MQETQESVKLIKKNACKTLFCDAIFNTLDMFFTKDNQFGTLIVTQEQDNQRILNRELLKLTYTENYLPKTFISPTFIIILQCFVTCA